MNPITNDASPAHTTVNGAAPVDMDTNTTTATTLSMAASIRPNVRDVLLGRGSLCWNHQGNIQFRTLIGEYHEVYKVSKSSRKRRSSIIAEIMDRMKQEGTRVLQLNKTSNEWIEATKSNVRDKISNALRDKYPAPDRGNTKVKTTRTKKSKTKKSKGCRPENDSGGSPGAGAATPPLVWEAAPMPFSSSSFSSHEPFYRVTKDEASGALSRIEPLRVFGKAGSTYNKDCSSREAAGSQPMSLESLLGWSIPQPSDLFQYRSKQATKCDCCPPSVLIGRLVDEEKAEPEGFFEGNLFDESVLDQLRDCLDN